MVHPQIPLLLPIGGHANFNNFEAGPNSAVHYYIKQACDAMGGESMYLWGGEGTGKTHLLEAALGDCHQRQGCAAYIPVGNPGALEPGMLDGLDAMDLVCIDGLDAIAGRADWEEALFHLYNRCQQGSCRLLMSGRAAPAGLDLQLDDLRSRLLAGLVLHLQPLNDDERISALQARARERGFGLPKEAALYLIRRYPRGLHSLFGALEKLDRDSLAQKRKITVNFLRESLDGL